MTTSASTTKRFVICVAYIPAGRKVDYAALSYWIDEAQGEVREGCCK
jgi:hypothetical protein